MVIPKYRCKLLQFLYRRINLSQMSYILAVHHESAQSSCLGNMLSSHLKMSREQFKSRGHLRIGFLFASPLSAPENVVQAVLCKCYKFD